MKKALPAAFGLLLTVLGVVWALQGLGYLDGSSMSGKQIWAIIGPVVAAFGISLLYVTFRGPQKR